MSEYAKYKVIRLPFPMELCKKAGVEEAGECDKYLEEILGEDYYWKGDSRGFDITYTAGNIYLDYIIQHISGEDSGDFGFSFKLNKEDLDLYRPLFDKLEIGYNPKDLRKVIYSYYNCCEPEDYYEVSENLFDDL